MPWGRLHVHPLLAKQDRRASPLNTFYEKKIAMSDQALSEERSPESPMSAEPGSREWLNQPPARNTNVDQWIKRLEFEFVVDGTIGGKSLFPVLEAETHFGEEAKRHPGSVLLRESFQAFLHNTIRVAGLPRAAGIKVPSNWYAPLLLEFASFFRGFRAAEVLVYAGYGMNAMPAFRDIRDRAVYISAVCRGESSFKRLEGLEEVGVKQSPIDQSTMDRLRKRRELAERAAMQDTIGASSGLPSAVVEELKGWTTLFHLEVHGGRLHIAADFDGFLQGKEGLQLAPRFTELSFAMYHNRFSEVAWMVLRCLPALQWAPNQFGAEWARSWKVLDEAFREDVLATWSMQKPLFGAITYMMDRKFLFGPANSFTDGL